jgi:peroxiredoxin
VVSTVLSLVVAIGAAWAFEATTGDSPKVEESIHLTGADRDSEVTIPAGPDDAGETAPATKLPRLDAGLGSLADYRGRPVVVNFFSTTCAPCVKEMPALQRVSERLGTKVAFVGVALQNSPREAQGLVDRTGIRYDVLVDRAGKLWAELGGLNLPTTFLLAADGTIVDVHPGQLTESAALDLISTKLLS